MIAVLIWTLAFAFSVLLAQDAPAQAPADPPDIPAFGVTADRAVGVKMSPANCNVTFTPTGEGWTLSRIVRDHVGAVCWTGPEAIRWRYCSDHDYGRTITLIFFGRHTSEATGFAVVHITLESEPDAETRVACEPED